MKEIVILMMGAVYIAVCVVVIVAIISVTRIIKKRLDKE